LLDVLYDNTKQVGWHMGYGDFDCKVDLSSFRKIPWEDNLPFFLMDFENSKTGAKLEIAPRTLLKKVIDDVHKAGYNPVCGFEFEWFNFRETPQTLQEKKFRDLQPLTPGMFGYSILRSGQNKDFFHSVVKNMGEFGVPIEGIHTETGPGVLEAAIQV
jgi:glutamine synthetase